LSKKMMFYETAFMIVTCELCTVFVFRFSFFSKVAMGRTVSLAAAATILSHWSQETLTPAVAAIGILAAAAAIGALMWAAAVVVTSAILAAAAVEEVLARVAAAVEAGLAAAAMAEEEEEAGLVVVVAAMEDGAEVVAVGEAVAVVLVEEEAMVGAAAAAAAEEVVVAANPQAALRKNLINCILALKFFKISLHVSWKTVRLKNLFVTKGKNAY
jgi:hypothetical protein